jgi:hypothetical protein
MCNSKYQIISMNEKDTKEILSRSQYWKEIQKREDCSPLINELREVVREHGIKILFWIEELAKIKTI